MGGEAGVVGGGFRGGEEHAERLGFADEGEISSSEGWVDGERKKKNKRRERGESKGYLYGHEEWCDGWHSNLSGFARRAIVGESHWSER